MTTEDTQFTVGKTTFFQGETRPTHYFASKRAFRAETPVIRLRN